MKKDVSGSIINVSPRGEDDPRGKKGSTTGKSSRKSAASLCTAGSDQTVLRGKRGVQGRSGGDLSTIEYKKKELHLSRKFGGGSPSNEKDWEPSRGKRYPLRKRVFRAEKAALVKKPEPWEGATIPSPEKSVAYSEKSPFPCS